ncbi:sulfotransferase [Marinobacter sp.]|uniref:sulfotransferase n=1 Tax=Marinobacter sp. TaxID=50741 RepID=UPI0034A5A648
MQSSYFSSRLKNPIFVVGFNNSGKSSAVKAFKTIDDLLVYPGEGNGDLWFRGHFPWITSSVSVGPIWLSPDEFINSVKDTNGTSFSRARVQLGAYQWLKGGQNLLNDSGMLAALALDIAPDFPDARFIHFIRDGWLASYITARLEWSRIIRSPGKYIEYDCPIRFQDVLKKMAHYWVWTLNRMDAVAEAMPGSVLELRYEDWWHNPEPMVDTVAHFLELPRPDHAERREPKGDLTQQLLSEMTDEECDLLDEILGPTMLRKGYPLDKASNVRVMRMPVSRP